MILWVSIISFLLDIVLSKYVLPNSIFLPLFTIVSLIIIYPYFNNNDYRYFKYIAILGLLYDIVIMNLLFYNFFIFMMLGFINMFFKYLLSDSLYVDAIITIILIIFYRLFNYLFYLIIGNEINFKMLLKSIYSSLILNIIYCIIVYFITEYIASKYRILKSK